MEYFAHIGILIGTYAVLAFTLDLQAGYTGQFSLAHAALWGVGAYTYGVFVSITGAPWILGVALSLVVGILIGYAASVPAGRLAPDQFVIATFAAQAVFVDLVKNWTSLTGGPSGLAGIQNALIRGTSSPPIAFFALVAIAFAAVALSICFRIVSSPFGRILKAIREDSTFADTAGRNTAAAKRAVYTITSALCACAGAIYASYMTFIDPSSFAFTESVFILTVVVAGGAGTLFGPLAAAVLLILFPEVLRLVSLPSALLGNIRGITVGLLLVAIVLLRPQGLLGDASNLRSRERKE